MRYPTCKILLICALLQALAAVDVKAAGCHGVLVRAAATTQCRKPGDSFKDCPACPEMMVVAAGSFAMGSAASSDETPVHNVTLARPLAIGKFEVTFAEWDTCVADGACKHVPDDQASGD